MRRTFIFLFALCLFPIAAVQAQDGVQQPLPSIVLKYTETLKKLPALSVQAKQFGTIPTDSASLTLAPFQRIVLISRFGHQVSTLISDGKTVTQWNATQYFAQRAPKTLDQLDIELPMGAAAEIAASLLTDSTSITDYVNLTDKGMVTLNGSSAHKIVSLEDGDTATFWLDAHTGLPLQAAYTGGRHNRLIVFTHYRLGSNAGKVRLPSRPLRLVRFVPTPKPKLLAAGTPAPDFTLPRARGDNGTLSLSSLKGQVVLIDFWASWCRPCKKTMPHIQNLQAILGGKGLTVLSVNTWDARAKMQTFLQQHPQYTSTFLYDDHPADQSVASSRYHVWGIPTVYVIDRAGDVAGAYIGDDPKTAARLTAKLAALGVTP